MTQLEPTSPFEELRQQQLQFYLFGLHLGKSRAPLLCNTIFKSLGIQWNYQIEETDDKAIFHQRLAQDNCIGSAVTMPNKIAFMNEVDMTDEIGTGVGAINTVYTRIQESKPVKIGTNTDTVGIKQSFLQLPEARMYVDSNKGKPGLVYGGGGASRSAVYALYKFFGCEMVYVVNRDKKEVQDLKEVMEQTEPSINIVYVESPEQARRCEKPQLAVLCVPNFSPVSTEEIQAKDTLKVFMEGEGAVLEMCYNPEPETILFHEFKAAGWVVISGIYAMIYQGLAQIQLWGGYSIEELPVERVKDVVMGDVRA